MTVAVVFSLALAFLLGVLVTILTNELVWTMAAQQACGVFVQ